MQTFPARRLAWKVIALETTGPSPFRVAILDTGLGRDGWVSSIDSTRIANPSYVPYGFLWDWFIGVEDVVTRLTLSKISDTARGFRGHGTAVTACAIGDGVDRVLKDKKTFGVLGTSSLGIARPIKISDNSSTSPYRAAAAICLLAFDEDRQEPGDPRVKVINCSFRFDKGEERLKRAIKLATKAGQIVIVSAGNDGKSIDEADRPFPAIFAPTDIRDHDDLLIMTVAGTWESKLHKHTPELSDLVGSREEFATGSWPQRLASNFGPWVSVSAPGDTLRVPNAYPFWRGGDTRLDGGTSYSAPYVAGLALDMTILDNDLSKVWEREPLRPLQIIELIEATAERVAGEEYGHGRINVWKALLCAINGGLPVTKPDRDKKLAKEFPSLSEKFVSEKDTKWYGFQIRTNKRNATVWINDGKGKIIQLKDTGTGVLENKLLLDQKDGTFNEKQDTSLPLGTVYAYKAVQPRTVSPLPLGMDTFVNEGVIGASYLIQFSIQADQIRGKILEIRKPGETEKDKPFFKVHMTPEKLKELRESGATFDDFIFKFFAVAKE